MSAEPVVPGAERPESHERWPEIEALSELLARTPRLTAGYGSPDDYKRAAHWLLTRGVSVESARPALPAEPSPPEAPGR